MDVGFLKLFLSNQYIDLHTTLDEGNIRGIKKVAREPTDGIWVSIFVTVVQERKKYKLDSDDPSNWPQTGVLSFLPSFRLIV